MRKRTVKDLIKTNPFQDTFMSKILLFLDQRQKRLTHCFHVMQCHHQVLNLTPTKDINIADSQIVGQIDPLKKL